MLCNLKLLIYHIKVIQIPVANCSFWTNCTSCLGNSNPLCGWCVVENKCSRRNECQNSHDSARWIHAAESREQCPLIVNVSPTNVSVDNLQTVSVQIPCQGWKYLIMIVGSVQDFSKEMMVYLLITAEFPLNTMQYGTV